MAQGIFGGYQANTSDLPADGLYIILIEVNAPSRSQAVIRQARVTGKDNDEVQDIRAKLIQHAVLHALAESQQQNEHENSPEHAKRGQQCAQFILAQGKQNLLQTVEHDVSWNTFLGADVGHCSG